MSTLDEAIAEGAIVAWPAEIAVDDHPGATGRPICYLATEALELGSPDGSTRTVGPGDVLALVEVEHAGTALARMLRARQIVPLPADRGIVALAAALFERCDRLEQLVADLHGAMRVGQ